MKKEELNAVIATVSAGKCSQEEIFTLSQELPDVRGSLTHFWTSAVNSGVLNAQGLYSVVMDERYPNGDFGKSEEITLLAISKNLMIPEQLVEISRLWGHWRVTLAAVATGTLSDDQVVTLSKHRPRQPDIWKSFAPHLRLEERTAEELVVLGEKVGKDEFWSIITPLIDSKK